MFLPSHNMNLVKISLIIALLGIFILLLMLNFIEPKLKNISEITIKDLNKNVKIQGEIASIKKYETKTKENFLIITIKDKTGEIDILVGNSENHLPNRQLTKNQTLTIIGKVSQYKDNLQIQTEKIISSP